MRNRLGKMVLAGALTLALGITALFSGTEKSYAASDVKLNKTSRNILSRRTYDFDVIGASEDAVITWKSSNEAIATVDNDGVVTGVTKGTAKITCTIKDGNATQKLTATVKIRKPAVKIVIKNKIETLEAGEEYDLNRKLTPSTSTDVTTWTSSDKSIATVDKNGVVTAKANGVVTITATTMSGKTDSCTITVFGAAKVTEAPKVTVAPKATQAPKVTTTPKATATPKPIDAPKDTGVTYQITELQSASFNHWHNTIDGNKISYAQQYGEANFMLPKALTAGDYKTLTVAFTSTDKLAVKVYDASGTQVHVRYDLEGTAEISLEELAADTKITSIGIMANNGACDATITGISFK